MGKPEGRRHRTDVCGSIFVLGTEQDHGRTPVQNGGRDDCMHAAPLLEVSGLSAQDKYSLLSTL